MQLTRAIDDLEANGSGGSSGGGSTSGKPLVACFCQPSVLQARMRCRGVHPLQVRLPGHMPLCAADRRDRSHFQLPVLLRLTGLPLRQPHRLTS